MNSDGFKRKLSAILSADVVGYSRLMSEDDGATVQTLTGHREMMSALIEQYQGRVVDSPGDNLLAEFESVTQAVNCSVEIQREMAERNAELPDDRKMEYRIGVNLGDVIAEGDRIYGDGVNIAARLESLAEPGGICISGFVYNQVKNRLKLEYEFMGEQSVKNIKEPVPVYRVLSFPGAAAHRVIKAKKNAEKSWRNRIMIGAAALIIIVAALSVWNFYFRGPEFEPASVDRMAYPLPDKPSIAILPFRNMSGDPNQEYIGDGISENITRALSKIGNMFVISRESVFIYKEKPAKIQQVAEELGVQYVLEGSVQKSGDRLRVTAQLIDALTGHHLWTEKYDREMKYLFDLQDEITKKIATSLHVELIRAEALIEARDTDNLEAWSKVAKAYTFWTKGSFEQARKLYEEAIKIDPNYAAAWSMIAWSHSLDVMFGHSDSPVESMKLAQEANQKAISINDQHPYVINYQGLKHLNRREYDKAIAKIKRALEIDPSYFGGHVTLADAMYRMGHFEESLKQIKIAMRLSPFYPPFALMRLGNSYFHLGRYEEAIEAFNQYYDRCSKGECSNSGPLISLAMVYAELGKENKARAYMAEALAINPNLSIEGTKRFWNFKNPAHLQRRIDANRKAGMPEKTPKAVP